MEIIPQLVHDVLEEYNVYIAANPNSARIMKGTEPKRVELAEKYSVAPDVVMGILSGRYDNLAGITRGGKVNLVRGRRTNEIMLYDTKGYAPSGKSIAGALEMSQDGLYLKCHECGDWFPDLSSHIKTHGLKSAQYKEKHQLKVGTALINEPMRVAHALRWMQMPVAKRNKLRVDRVAALKKRMVEGTRKVGKRSYLMGLNAKQKCPVQTLHDLKALADKLGRQPSIRELKANGISHAVIRRNWGTTTKAMKLLGDYTPAPVGKHVGETRNVGRPRWYTKENLIALLKDFYKQQGRAPFCSDCKRGMLPSDATFIRRFGSWTKALKAAGLKQPSAKAALILATQQPQIVNGYYV